MIVKCLSCGAKNVVVFPTEKGHDCFRCAACGRTEVQSAAYCRLYKLERRKPEGQKVGAK